MGGLNIQLGSKHVLIDPRNSQERKQDIGLKIKLRSSIYCYGKVITMHRNKKCFMSCDLFCVHV